MLTSIDDPRESFQLGNPLIEALQQAQQTYALSNADCSV